MENGMGLSASDVALLNRGDGFGWGGDGGAFMWIFALLILAGGGFNGWGNNGFANAIGYENLATSNEVQRGFDNQNLYNETSRDLSGLAMGQANLLANQNECCCSTKMEIAQNRFEAAMNTASINENTTAQTQKILDAISQNKIEALQAQVNALELQNATQNVVRYPNSWTYNAGMSPFCGCGSCGC